MCKLQSYNCKTNYHSLIWSVFKNRIKSRQSLGQVSCSLSKIRQSLVFASPKTVSWRVDVLIAIVFSLWDQKTADCRNLLKMSAEFRIQLTTTWPTAGQSESNKKEARACMQSCWHPFLPQIVDPSSLYFDLKMNGVAGLWYQLHCTKLSAVLTTNFVNIC